MPGIAKISSEQALDAMRAMIAEGAVRKGDTADAVCGMVPELYVEPANDAELSRVMEYARRENLQVAPRGGGTKLDWGTAPAAIDLMISTAKFGRILEYAPDDMTVTVEAGVSIARLQAELAAHGQRLALDCLWPQRATVGGIVASNDSGALRLRYGGVRDLIIGITAVLADGTIATSGGKVVKNVAGYDLPKLMTGALGTLGVITRAVFRLHPLPQSSRTLSFSFRNSESANDFMLAITDSIAVPTGLQMRVEASGKIEVDVRIDGIAASVAAQSEIVSKLAGGVKPAEIAGDPWQAREQICNPVGAKSGAASGATGVAASVMKLSVLPAQLGATAEFVREELASAEWSLLMHSTGLAWLRADATDCAQIADFITALREYVAPNGGTAVLLKAPAALRQRVDVWGETNTALRLMKRIKQQFDPSGILNRGRFVGGI
jgi:glycolate oxidase FAD binding subunit